MKPPVTNVYCYLFDKENIQKWNTTKITDKNYEKTFRDPGSEFVKL